MATHKIFQILFPLQKRGNNQDKLKTKPIKQFKKKKKKRKEKQKNKLKKK